jgi:hypothetical protein
MSMMHPQSPMTSQHVQPPAVGLILIPARCEPMAQLPVQDAFRGNDPRLNDYDYNKMAAQQGQGMRGCADDQMPFGCFDCVEQKEEEVATPRLGPGAQMPFGCFEPPPLPYEQKEGDVTMSQGSIGHPYNCAPACKYAQKKRGCKDGLNCTHCHLCMWHSRRQQATKYCDRKFR